MQVSDAAGGGDAGVSDRGAAAAMRKDATMGAGADASARRHAAPAGAGQGARGDGGAMIKRAAEDDAHVILTVSPGKGATESVTASGARAAGHNATATAAARGGAGGAPGSAGAKTASVGTAQPSARERQENGGGVTVADGVAVANGVSDEDAVAVGEIDAVCDGVSVEDCDGACGDEVGDGVGAHTAHASVTLPLAPFDAPAPPAAPVEYEGVESYLLSTQLLPPPPGAP